MRVRGERKGLLTVERLLADYFAEEIISSGTSGGSGGTGGGSGSRARKGLGMRKKVGCMALHAYAYSMVVWLYMHILCYSSRSYPIAVC